MITCDNVVDIDIDLLEEDYLKLGEPACMLVPVLPVAGLAGDYIFHKNHVVTDLDRHTPSEIYCSGIQILNPCKINELTEEADDFYSVWRQLIALEQLYVSAIYPKKWFAVDTVEQLAMLNSMYR